MDTQLPKKENQDIQVDVESIDYIIANTPIALNSNDEAVKKAGYYYLPFSTGFEMEFDNDNELTKEMFKDIPLIDLNINNSEQRFRISNGIKGLKALQNISIILKENAIFSDYSGIHYHVDCTDWYDKITDTIINDNEEWILNELDSWEYKGTYNSRQMSRSRTWVRLHSLKTIEFRIGEMTFDYPLLFKRITHCNDIVRKFMYKVKAEWLKTNSPILLYDDDIESVLKNRKKKI